jgi:hypothetical protein
VTAVAAAGLGARLVGAWRLDAYIIEDPAGDVIDAPFGRAPQGALIYTADGQVAVHAMAPDRTRCETDQIVACPPDRKLAAFDTYFGYSGTYRLDGDRVTHRVTVSAFPDWTGTELRRTVTVDGDVLVLRGSDPAPRIPVLTWRREGGGG